MHRTPRQDMGGVDFGILGALRIVADGREVSLASPRQRALLSVLLVDAGQVVSTDRIADVLWGLDQPEDPAGAVHTHVSRTRSVLRRHGVADASGVLVTRPPGYLLDVGVEQVDAGRFEQLVEAAQAADAPETSGQLLEEALALWRGPPLAEFDHEPARTEAARLAELRLHARELHADALLAMGRDEQVVAELATVRARHPLRERLHGQLMVALARRGRQAEALSTYRSLRDRLVDELGVEPSAPLRRLEQAILQQADPLPWPTLAWTDESAGSAAAAGTPAPAPDSRAMATPPGPAEPLTSLVGRQAQVSGAVAAFAGARVMVFTGVGGVGKSRLAVRVARELARDYPDGVDWCDLAGTDDPAALPDVVATTLGLGPADEADVTATLVETLRPQRRLLVLDNCEHVLAAASALVEQVVRTCPQVDVLATSRQPLEIRGQQLWPVPPLGIEEDGDAVTLFRQRARAVDPAFTLDDEERRTVAQVCRRLDGLPLAIELAAARIRSMTPADIATRLDDRFALLTDDPRVSSSRHRSLAAVVDWSYDLLAKPTRRLFDRLSVFAGGFDLDAVEQVCAGDGVAATEIPGRLAELVDHSLVAVDRSGRHARYRLLETLRTYGQDRLGERGELATWKRRHAEHFTALVEEAVAGIQSAEEARWVHRLHADFANLRVAHAWALDVQDADLALRLAAGLRTYAYHRLRDEVYDWAVRSLELPDAGQQPAYPGALLTAAVGWTQRGHLDRARALAEQALATRSDEAVTLRAQRLLAELALYEGRLDETERRGREVVEAARAAGRPYDEALGQLYRVHAAAYSGRVDDAMAALAAGWRIVQDARIPSLEAGFRFLEGEVRLDADPVTALAELRRAIEVARSVDSRFIEGVARVTAASLEARHGQPDDALVAFRDIVDHWRRSGDWAHMWTTLHNLVMLLRRVGADEPAAVLLGAVETATTGAPPFGADAERLQESAETLRVTLGEEAFARATATGRAMTDDEAVGHGLATIDRLLATAPAAGR